MLPVITVPAYVPGPTCNPTPLPVLVTFVIREPVEPPTNWMPLPLNPLIVRALVFVACENTTLFTFDPITSPLVPALVLAPSSVTASFTATLFAAAIAIFLRAAVPPTAPASVIARPDESVSLLAPSSVEENEMSPPALSVVIFCSITAPAYVCEPCGAVTSAANRIPLLGPTPSVIRLTAPAPLAETGLAIDTVSDTPAPVSMLKLWLAAPLLMVFKLTPPMPITTASVPAPPATERPVKPLTSFRSTAIVSAAEFTVIPAIGAAVEISPKLRAAVIVSTLAAAL